MTNSELGERFERAAQAENQKSGWTIVLIAIAALVTAVIALTFAYDRVQFDDKKQFAHFAQQLQDDKRKLDDGTAERERLKGEIANGAADRERLAREIDALKEVLAKNNVPIPPEIVGAETPATTQPRETTTTSRTSTSETTTSTTTTTQPRPSTTTTTAPPKCTVPTLPRGQCIVP